MQKGIIALLILGLSIGGYWLFTNRNGQSGVSSQAVPVEVVKTVQQTVFDSVEALGNSSANESVTITANVSESISDITFTDGQRVKKGDVLALLDQKEEQAQLKAAELQLEEHKRELARIENLLQNKAAAKRDYDERRTQAKITEQQIEEIKARIADRTIEAPFDGVLGIRQVSVGSLVQPGAVITTIDDASKIKLDFNVPSIYLSHLKTGIPIEARSDAIKDKVFTGSIETVNSRVDTVTRAILVRAVIDNPEYLIKPGLLMQVTLLKGERNALIIPEEATIQQQDKHFVMVVNPETQEVSKREVQIGIRRPGIVEIQQGLSDGEVVIVRGIHTVRPGQKIDIKKTWEGPGNRTPESSPIQTEAAPGGQ